MQARGGNKNEYVENSSKYLSGNIIHPTQYNKLLSECKSICDSLTECKGFEFAEHTKSDGSILKTCVFKDDSSLHTSDTIEF